LSGDATTATAARIGDSLLSNDKRIFTTAVAKVARTSRYAACSSSIPPST
jgi:hypothetical protein